MYCIPQPKHLKANEGSADISKGFSLEKMPSSLSGYGKRFLNRCTSYGIPIRMDSKPVSLPEDSAHQTLIAEQAYRLTIGKDEIVIDVQSDKGLCNAFATLSQLEKQASGYLPCLCIEDYPDIPYRGVMLDVSRGKIPNRTKIKELVHFLATYKYNVLQLYMEDCYVLERHPQLGLLNGYYDKEEVAFIDQLCNQYCIELQPNIQSLSHVHGLLRNPGYQSLTESSSLFSFGAGNPEVYKLLDDIYAEVLPWFTSKTVNLDLDEAYDLGTGYSKDAVSSKGAQQVFTQHICKVAELARNHGAKTVQIWGDCLNTYPDLQQQVSQHVQFIDWNYNPLQNFPSLEHYDGMNTPFWIAPGTSSWNGLFPRVQDAMSNIQNYVSQAKEKHVQGILMAHWGDYGHHQPISFSYHGFICGAEAAYNSGRTEQSLIDDAMTELYFADKAQKAGFDQLASINKLPSLTTTFKSQSFYAYFDDMFKGLSLIGDDKYAAITKETFVKMGELAETAFEFLAQSNDESTFQKELVHAAQCYRFTAEKALLGITIKEAFACGAVDDSILVEWIRSLKLLYRKFLALRDQFTQLWNAEAIETGREGALYLFDKAASRFAEAVIYLNSQRLALIEGLPLDNKMEDDTAHEGYTTLWTGNCTNLWDRAYPWR